MNTTPEDDFEYFENRSCGRKHRYPTRAEAMRGRRVLSERLRIYFCEFCQGYHIGGGQAGGHRNKRKHHEKQKYKRDKRNLNE